MDLVNSKCKPPTKSWLNPFQYLGQKIGFNLFTAEHGVSHVDELFMMFKPHKIPIEGVYSDEDKATSENMLKLWTDFAKTGNPTPGPSTIQWMRLMTSLGICDY